MAKDYMPYLIMGGLGLGALYLMTRPAAAGVPAAAPAQVTVTGPSDFIGLGTPGGTTQALIARAQQELGLPLSGLSVRGLRPEDLGLTTSWSHTSTGANVWDTWINTTIADATFVAIEGVSYAGSNFEQARITAAASVSGFWNLSWISGLSNQVYYEASPIFIDQNQPLVVSIIASGVATEEVALLGTVVEKSGLVIA